jgi:hypothetical protein
MANPGFFNANQYRDYPFASRISPLIEEGWSSSASMVATELPQECIVDFGAILRPSARFVTVTDFVYLHSVSRAGTVLTITFAASNLPRAYAITFTVDTATVNEFHTQWQDSAAMATSSILAECDDAPAWSAYLVTGDMTAWLDQLGDGETLFFVTGLWQIMQGRLQNLAGTQVQSVTIANVPRTVVTATTGCESESVPVADPQVVRLVYNCMVGDIKLHEGFNCGMRYDLRDNAIVISASPGAGAGVVCEDFPSYPEEERPAGSPYYSGGPACSSIVRYINGASAADLKITAGAGFTVTADTDNPNTLRISRSLNASVICADPALAEDDLLLSSASIGEG